MKEPWPLPEKWEWLRLGDCADLITKGSTPTSYGFDYRDEGIAFVRVEHLSNGIIQQDRIKQFISKEADDELRRSRLQTDDILFSIAGTIGKTALVREFDVPANTNQALALIRGFSARFHPQFLRLFLTTAAATRQAALRARGAAMNNISLGDIKNLVVPAAPIDAQIEIVATVEELLSDLEAGLAALERGKTNLKRYRTAVLKAAVEGKLTEEWRKEHPDVEPASELLKRILAERRTKWDEEQLKKYGAKGKKPPNGWREKYNEPISPNGRKDMVTPDGWGLATVDQLFVNHDGKRIPLKRADRDKRSGPYPYYGASGVIDTIDDHLFDGNYLLVAEDGANLLSRSTPIAFQASGQFWVNNHAHVLETLAGVPVSFGEILFNATNLQFHVTGTAQPKLPQSSMNKMVFPLPPLNEQLEIVSEVERLLSLAGSASAAGELAVAKGGRLRQAILKAAFSGGLVPSSSPSEANDGQ